MSELYDFRQDSIRRDLDAAFAAGEQRGYQKGRDESDEYLMAECVELRVDRWEREALAYRQGIETALMMVVAFVAVVVSFGFIGWMVLA